jgi:sugar O-acyltransferase (sialic acid O-acetyltransferase NeuD family)
MKRLAILGASGHGKVVADCAEAAGWKDISFYDDAWPKCDRNGAWSVVGDTRALLNNFVDFDGVFIAIGDNATRYQKQQFFQLHGCNLVSIIHPKAVLSPYASVSEGTVLMAGAVVNPYSRIGEACVINSNAVVEHDCTLEYGVHISPGALIAGNVFVGSRTWIGIGSSVRQRITITSDVIVGAGTVVVKDITCKGTYIGNPAKKLL